MKETGIFSKYQNLHILQLVLVKPITVIRGYKENIRGFLSLYHFSRMVGVHSIRVFCKISQLIPITNLALSWFMICIQSTWLHQSGLKQFAHTGWRMATSHTSGCMHPSHVLSLENTAKDTFNFDFVLAMGDATILGIGFYLSIKTIYTQK